MRKKYWPYVFLLPFIITYLAFNLFPLLYSFYISLTDWKGFGAMNYVGLFNYRTLFRDSAFFRSVGNSFIIVLEAMIPNQLISLILALIMNYNLTKRSTTLFRNTYFLPYLTSPIAIGLIFQTVFDGSYGLLNEGLKMLGLKALCINWLETASVSKPLVAFVILWRYVGYVAFVYLAGLQSIDPQIIEAARIDGASYVRTYRSIVIPILKPIIAYQATLGIIGCLKTFEEPLMMYNNSYNGGPSYAAQTMNMRFIQTAFKSGQYGYGAAVGYTMFVIIVVTTIVFYALANRGEER